MPALFLEKDMGKVKQVFFFILVKKNIFVYYLYSE